VRIVSTTVLLTYWVTFLGENSPWNGCLWFYER
jgi:hypothetical protein